MSYYCWTHRKLWACPIETQRRQTLFLYLLSMWAFIPLSTSPSILPPAGGGDPLLCQLSPMMFNSNRNIVPGENDFILWKTMLPHSFISPRRPPRPPLNPRSGCYSLLCLRMTLHLWITCAPPVLCPWLILVRCFSLVPPLSALKVDAVSFILRH